MPGDQLTDIGHLFWQLLEEGARKVVWAMVEPATEAQLYVEVFFAMGAFVLGAIVGSFLNVVITRLPKGDSILYPPSHCPTCGSDIRFFDNIPIASFLLLRGRCRDCGEPISFRYPLIEFLTGTICVALYFKWGPTPAFMIFFVFCCALLAVFWIDLEHLIIPDVISLTGIAIGVMSCITGLVPEMDWKFSLLGTVLGGAALYIPAWLYEKVRGLEGLGGGDVKLLAMIGSFTGPYGVVFVLFFGSLMGSLCVLLGIALRGVESKTPIPFAPFLTSASVAYVFVGKLIIDRLYWLSASY